MTTLANRYDIVFLFEVTNGNPNGDPDAGNLPRINPESNHGLVTDVSLKRKIRNYVELAKGAEPGYRIYVQEGSILNERHREAYKAVRTGDAKVDKEKKLSPQGDNEARAVTSFMCENFFDVRTFGAVMSTGINAGQVRGPVQLAFASSVEPIMPMEITITRMAATTEKEKADRDKEDGEGRTENRTMGRKYIVPYGLYRAHIFVNASLADRTGFSEADMQLLFEALANMFEHDRSAARGEMSARKIVAFRHGSTLGNAPAHRLFDEVKVIRLNGDERYDTAKRLPDDIPPARSFADYEVVIGRAAIPDQVEVLEIL